MKKFYVFLFLAIAFMFARIAFADLNDGLVAYYPFNGNANDESGNGNHGTAFNGATLTEDRFGNNYSAYYFDGEDDYIDFPETVFGASISEFTLSTWVLTNDKDYSEIQKIVYKGNIEGESYIGVEDNNFQFGVKLANYEWYQVTSPIVKNTWVHLVGTYCRGNKIEIWVNGELSEETFIPESDLFTSDTHHSSIGAYSQAEHEQEHWDNVIDDVCIYNRALSESEIQDLYNNPYVILTEPANNATDVAVNTAITATFSEAMDSSTITPDTFLVNDGSINITAVTYSNRTATFTPATDLDYNTTYTATITTGAKDLTGNALEDDYTWSFTTQSEPGGEGCFIATAAYGSSMEPHVKVLRQFRDRFLLVNMVGKGFVRLYNTYSPPIANFIAKNDSLRAIVRLSLIPVIGVSWVALKLGPVSTMALMLLLGISLVGLVSLRRKKVKN